MFISFLYMFRAPMCPSSGETTVFMWHLVLVILCSWLSSMQGRFHPAYQTVSYLITSQMGEVGNEVCGYARFGRNILRGKKWFRILSSDGRRWTSWKWMTAEGVKKPKTSTQDPWRPCANSEGSSLDFLSF